MRLNYVNFMTQFTRWKNILILNRLNKNHQNIIYLFHFRGESNCGFFVWWKCFIAMTDCLKIHKYYSVYSFIFINTFYNVRNLFPCQSKAICVNRKTQTRYDINSSMANQNHKALMFLSNFVPVACFTFSFPWDSYSIDFHLKKMLEKISKHIYFRWIFRVTT